MLQVLCRTIIEGWPESKKNFHPAIDPYTSYKNELSFTDGLILRGDKIVIPQALSKNMLEKLHSSHLGITGTRRRAAECMRWPNMSNDIKDLILQ